MKIINPSVGQAITADTTLITADNTMITCDTTFLSGEIILKVIPREQVINIYVLLYNELTFESLTFTAVATNDRGYMTFSVPVSGIKEGDSFELTITKDSFEGELLYRDKAYATSVQDLENYKLNYPDSNGVIIVK
jgi:hypothetical protein